MIKNKDLTKANKIKEEHEAETELLNEYYNAVYSDISKIERVDILTHPYNPYDLDYVKITFTDNRFYFFVDFMEDPDYDIPNDIEYLNEDFWNRQ